MSTATLSPTILLVDDDDTTRFLLRRIVHLHWPRVRVLEAEDGQQGLDLVQEHCQATQVPHSLLVLLDLNMPVLNGWQFLQQYQELPQRCHQATTVVVSSTSTLPEEQTRAQALVAAWQPKPVFAEQLATLVQHYLPSALN